MRPRQAAGAAQRSPGWFCVLALALTTLAPAPRARAAPPIPPPLPQQADRDEPGLALTIEPLDASAPKVSDTRAVRMLALYVPAGQPASPFVAPGPFRATWA